MRRKSLEGTVVVVTGASSGLGRASALAFADHGARIVVASRVERALEPVVEECRRRGAAAIALGYDAADPEGTELVASRALDEFGRIDVWVQNPAALIVGPFGSEPLDEVERLIDVNVLGYVLGARAAMAQFQQQGSGTLVLVSSLLGIIPSPAAPTYSMSKFAIRGLALSLRQMVAGQRNVHVCTVMPGPIDTTLFENAANHSGRALRAIPPAYAPERVAAAVVACARRPRRQVTAGAAMWMVLAAHHVVPRATEFLVGQTSARLLQRRSAADETEGALFESPSTGEMHGPWRRGRLRRRAGEWVGRTESRRGARRHRQPHAA